MAYKDRKPIQPKPNNLTIEQASALVMKRYGGMFKKLAKL